MTIGTLAALADLSNGGPVLTGQDPIVAGGGAPSPGWQLDQELRVEQGETVSGVQQQAFHRMVNAYEDPIATEMMKFAQMLPDISPMWRDRVGVVLEWYGLTAKALREFADRMVAARAPATTWNSFVQRVAQFWPPVMGAVGGELKMAQTGAPVASVTVPAFDAYNAAGLPGPRPPGLAPATQKAAPGVSWVPFAVGGALLGGAVLLFSRR